MSDLYPTKTRLQLLDDVDAGEVYRSNDGNDYDRHLVTGRDSLMPVKVNARLVELDRAGWVERPDGSLYWRLTDAGRGVRAGVR